MFPGGVVENVVVVDCADTSKKYNTCNDRSAAQNPHYTMLW